MANIAIPGTAATYRALLLCVLPSSTGLSKHRVGVETLLSLDFWDCGRACTLGGGNEHTLPRGSGVFASQSTPNSAGIPRSRRPIVASHAAPHAREMRPIAPYAREMRPIAPYAREMRPIACCRPSTSTPTQAAVQPPSAEAA